MTRKKTPLDPLMPKADHVSAGHELARLEKHRRKKRPKHQGALIATKSLAEVKEALRQGDVVLTELEAKFVLAYSKGLPPRTAAREAGYDTVSEPKRGVLLLEQPHIAAAVELERERFAEEARVDRQKVVAGFQEAVAIARVQADPIAMIAGWREIGRMCGYYEATKHKIEVNHTGEVALKTIAEMSDQQLLELADKNVIEGQFERVDEVQRTP